MELRRILQHLKNKQLQQERAGKKDCKVALRKGQGGV